MTREARTTIACNILSAERRGDYTESTRSPRRELAGALLAWTWNKKAGKYVRRYRVPAGRPVADFDRALNAWAACET